MRRVVSRAGSCLVGWVVLFFRVFGEVFSRYGVGGGVECCRAFRVCGVVGLVVWIGFLVERV